MDNKINDQNDNIKLDAKDLKKVTGGSSIHAGERRPDEFGGEHFATGTKRGYIVNEWGNIIGER